MTPEWQADDFWEVTPHYDKSYDTQVSPCQQDPEGKRAMEAAKDILETLWDQADSLENLDIAVTLRKIKMDPADVPED